MRSLKYMMSLLLSAALLTGCASTGQSQTKEGGSPAATRAISGPEIRELNILTSSPHLAEMVQTLSEPNHHVDYMAETEEQLKSLAPDPALMEEKPYDAFFYVGAGYEPFLSEFTGGLDKNRVYVVNVSRGIDVERHQVNKLDIENYYYLTNSTNYKIGLNSIKNALTELDPARRTIYNENFLKLSREIDQIQNEIRDFMEDRKDVIFISDSDLVTYTASEYGKELLTMTQFIERMAKQTSGSTQGLDTQGSSVSGSKSTDNYQGENRIFLYSEDVAIQKYSEDIVRYGLLPVKIHLYNENLSLMDSFYGTFREIRKAIETRE